MLLEEQKHISSMAQKQEYLKFYVALEVKQENYDAAAELLMTVLPHLKASLKFRICTAKSSRKDIKTFFTSE